MEAKLFGGMFGEEMPLWGVGMKTSMQPPNELKYWLNGYAFYKREDGTFFMEEMEDEHKENFFWGVCAMEEHFACPLEQANDEYQEAIQKLERISEISAPYRVAPISFRTILNMRNKIELRNIVFITKRSRRYFEVETASIYYNITTKTYRYLDEFPENTFAEPHLILIDENGNVSEAKQ